MPLSRRDVHADLDDAAVLSAWLSVFGLKSPQTARSYRAQANKFVLFLRLTKPLDPPLTVLQMATESDVALYELALNHRPPPGASMPDLALSPQQMAAHALKDQPFAHPLKRSSVNLALSVLHALYEFLRTPNGAMPHPYVTINPVRRVRRASNRVIGQTDRYITLEGIQAMQAYALSAIDRARAGADAASAMRYERMLWMFTLLFGLWARRAEICRLRAGDFRQRPDGSWRVSLVRKGDTEDELPVADWVIQGFRRYRESLGLPSQWTCDDPSPALHALRRYNPTPAPGKAVSSVKQDRTLSAQTLYLEVTQLAQQTASEIDSLLPDEAPDKRARVARRLQATSPHWFRHTGPTLSINGNLMSIEHASKLLGHASLSTTTQMYYHADDEQAMAGLNDLGKTLKGISALHG